MQVGSLRGNYPRFTYNSFASEIDSKQGRLKVRFYFTNKDHSFSPEIDLPYQEGVISREELNNFIFHLGLIEAISYWKATCSPEFKVEAGALDDEQIAWWHDLFINGLGEFFYVNQIDFTQPNFLRITSSSEHSFTSTKKKRKLEGDLVLIGGGKDSVVTVETLKGSHKPRGALLLNPTKAALDTANIAGIENILIARRTIDKHLLEMNKQGYLNGHTPFSAYLAFLGVFMAAVHGYEKIIVSNEQSANEGNVIFHRQSINHQYSKSIKFEKKFRCYVNKYFGPSYYYFSFLRPLYEMQIALLFSDSPDYHYSFHSCNVGQRENRWCGQCPKCAFTYMSLAPFLPLSKMKKIFGQDYYRKQEIASYIYRLVGLKDHKPFDCVGTKEESVLAIGLSIRRYCKDGLSVPPLLLKLEKELSLTEEKINNLWKEKMEAWNIHHFLPSQYASLLRQRLTNLLGKYEQRNKE